MDRGMNLNCNTLEVVRVENGKILSRATLKNLTYTEWRNKTQKIGEDYYEKLLFADAVSEKIIKRYTIVFTRNQNGSIKFARTK